MWIGCTFVSILIHEMGHVFVALAAGRPSHVVLYGMGGLAIGDFHLRERWKRIAISLGGPALGLLLYGVIWGYKRFGADPLVLMQQPALFICITMLLWMNLWWNLLNLMPVWPLDGGHISREVCSAIFPGNGIRYSLGFSFLFAGLAAFYSIIAYNDPNLWYPPLEHRFAAVLFGILAINSFLNLQATQRPRRDDGWERDPDWWK
jgi:stage IV sporulation protein FB